MPRTALVTGASGLLGREVVKAFEHADWTVHGTGLTRASPPSILKVDLLDSAAVERCLDDTKPNVVVHCAAQRFPDKVEANPQGSRALNVDSTRALARACQSRSALLVYISTDYVFSGAEGEAPYEADAAPAPTNAYGQLKLDGERAVLEETSASGLGVVLRVPVLYGPTEAGHGESAVNTLVDSVTKAQTQRVVMDDWSVRYPTHTEDVGRVCVDVARTLLDAPPPKETGRSGVGKILQFSSEVAYTKYQICELLAEIMGLGMGQMEANKQGNDPAAKVQRPYDCHLSTRALRDLGVNVSAQDFKAWWRWQFKAYRK